MKRLLPVLLLAACHRSSPPADDAPWAPAAESCTAPSLDAPATFAPCTTGSGHFGEWFVDSDGLPAFRYRADQYEVSAASWFNTEGRERRDHWFALGNDRLNVLFFNDGNFEVTTQDRGESYLNKIDEPHRNFGGGFSFVDDGKELWCSAYKWRPKPSATLREQHQGWSLAQTEHAGARVTHRVFSPPGLDAVVLDDVTVTNTSGDDRALKLYEYWDVARRDIVIDWLVSGIPFSTLPTDAVTMRDAHNADFDEQIVYHRDQQALVLTRRPAATLLRPDPAVPDPVDFYPGDPFLAQLTGTPSELFWDQTPFFGEAGPKAPAQLAAHAQGGDLTDGTRDAFRSGQGQTRMFVMRTDLKLKPGESKTVRYAYGYGPLALKDEWKTVQPSDAAHALQPAVPRFVSTGAPYLQRELAWHATQLELSKGHREYQDVTFVPQGSAYLYLHGADGVPRDLGLFSLPLAFTDPALARNELKLYMQLQFAADRRFSYAFQGHGELDDALGLHHAPSDLDLAFLWAVANYVGATGDTSLLDEKVPYWPKEALPDATGYDHLHDAARHLLDGVGFGPHGLIRVGTGDWSDGIVSEAPNRDLAIAMGESVPNSQEALYVLPLAAQLFDARDPALAAELRSHVAPLCEAVKKTWTGQQFGRAYFGDGVLLRGNEPDLEAIVWALIGDCFVSPADRATLVEVARSKLDVPSPAGAMLREHGQVWPAISALLTWGYLRSGRDDLAQAHFERNTMAAHAIAYPEVWAGTWSGPDGLQGPDPGDPGPGMSWYSAATPMTDFPVQNNNQHAMPLWAMLKVAGVETLADGLQLQPHGEVALRTQLLDLDYRGHTLKGTWRPPGAASKRLTFVGSLTSLTVNGQTIAAGQNEVTVAGFPVAFEATFAP
ncbi:MAG: hypothetical protein QM723_13840 [Myxococcaceae bacterium]